MACHGGRTSPQLVGGFACCCCFWGVLAGSEYLKWTTTISIDPINRRKNFRLNAAHFLFPRASVCPSVRQITDSVKNVATCSWPIKRAWWWSVSPLFSKYSRQRQVTDMLTNTRSPLARPLNRLILKVEPKIQIDFWSKSVVIAVVTF